MSAESALERALSTPTEALVGDFRRLDGDILILGAGGKMGPSLARLAVRALRGAGSAARVIAAARFSDRGLVPALAADGVEPIVADLLEQRALAALPDVPNVIYMVGQKFGTAQDSARTWALNAWLPGVVADRFRQARIVAFSTGNVYPFHPTNGPGPAEGDPVGPVGEYAQSALARERVLEFLSGRHGIPMAILRLNYAIEPRYGVMRDLADRVREGRAVDVAMGWVNLIWQRDANAIALRALLHCATPPLVLNVTGPRAVSVRALAMALGRRFGMAPRFEGTEEPTALLSNATLMERLFGPPEVTVDQMIDEVATWVEEGGRSLDKPTHFESREGAF